MGCILTETLLRVSPFHMKIEKKMREWEREKENMDK
jgi:hypothetical protein